MSEVVDGVAEPRSAAPSRQRAGLVPKVTAETVAQVLVIVALLGAWEGVARAGLVHPFLLPPLDVVAARILRDLSRGTVALDLGLTLYRALSGFAIAAAIGIPLGIWMSRSRPVHWFLDPLVSFGFPTPKIAFLPIFILWFGIFDTSKVVMVAFSCFFPIVSATYAGAASVDKWVVWSARSFGATPNQILWDVVLRMAMPQIMTGIQIAVPVALITTVVTEMLMGGAGVGGRMMQAGRFADSAGVFAGIVEIAILGTVVVRSVEAVRGRLLAWHQEARQS